MEMFGFIVKTLFVCVFINYYVEADSQDDMKMKFVNILVECSMEYPLTADEIEQLKEKKVAESDNIKCMFACAYKRTGMMDDKGLMSVEGINEMSKKYFGNDSEKTKKAEAFTNACKSVNDVEVSDGEKGCERAALLFKCSVEKAAQFDFTV